jgi:AcrR family transcriptional regulator
MKKSGRVRATALAGRSDRTRLRADAHRNRVGIVEAARTVFAERGLDVPLEDIARHAGVGIATLYRHFPTRDDLIAASFERKMADYAEAVHEALRAPDAWSGFCGYLERVCAMQAADKGLKDVLTMTFPAGEALERQRMKAYRAFAELVRLAQAEGRLRKEFVPEDLVLVLMANAGVLRGTRDAAPDAWKRFVAFMIEAFRADRAEPLPKPPSPRQMRRAMHLAGRSSRGPLAPSPAGFTS